MSSQANDDVEPYQKAIPNEQNPQCKDISDGKLIRNFKKIKSFLFVYFFEKKFSYGEDAREEVRQPNARARSRACY